MLKKIVVHFTALVFWFLPSTSGFTQILPFDLYSIKDGLPSNWITCIYQDSRGYLWIGGDGGLSVYDGINFKNYTKDDGLPVGHVWSIHESRLTPGVMFIGTHGGGLSRLVDGKISSIKLGKTAVENVVAHIVEDSEGVVWCGTAWGMYRVKGDSVSFFNTGNDSGYVALLHETRDGQVLFSIGHALYRYSPKTGTARRIELNLGVAILTCAVEDADGSFWFGTNVGEILHVQNDRIVASRATPFGELQGMLDDRDGNLWFATDFGLLKVSKSDFVNGEIINYTQENGLPEAEFEFCIRDRENTLWFGSRNKGLLKLAERYVFSFPIMRLHAGLLNRPAVSDSSGHLFVVSGEGLWEIWKDGSGSWQKHLHPIIGVPGKFKRNEFSRRLISVDIDGNGLLWAATQDGSLDGFKVMHRREQSSILRLVHQMQFGGDPPTVKTVGMLIDSNDRLWYNIWTGPLVQIDLSSMKVREDRVDLPPGTPQAISQDSSGNLWIGSFVEGVSIFAFENGKYHLTRRLTVADGLAGDQIRSIVHRRNGEVWIGTRFDGISVYRDGKFRTINTKNGLLNNAVWAMAEDDDGRMWVGTSAGLQYTLPGDTARFVTNRKLIGKQFGGVGLIAGERVVWAVSTDELTLFEYGRQSPAGEPPLIYITEMRVNGREREMTNGAKFSHNENLCVLRFNGLSFKDE